MASQFQGQRRWTAERRWAVVRLTLGTLQTFGAAMGFVLLLQVGVTRLTLAVVIATSPLHVH